MAIPAFSETFSKGLYDKTDNFFTATALGNAGAINSSYFRLGKNGARSEMAIVFNSAVVVASGQTVTVELTFGDTSDGTGWVASNKRAVKIYTNETIANGTVLKYVPDSNVGHYCRVTITTTENHSAKTVDGRIYHIA